MCFITFLAIYQGKFGFGKFQQKLGLRSDPPPLFWAKCPTFSENAFWGPPKSQAYLPQQTYIARLAGLPQYPSAGANIDQKKGGNRVLGSHFFFRLCSLSASLPTLTRRVSTEAWSTTCLLLPAQSLHRPLYFSLSLFSFHFESFFHLFLHGNSTLMHHLLAACFSASSSAALMKWIQIWLMKLHLFACSFSPQIGQDVIFKGTT